MLILKKERQGQLMWLLGLLEIICLTTSLISSGLLFFTGMGLALAIWVMMGLLKMKNDDQDSKGS